MWARTWQRISLILVGMWISVMFFFSTCHSCTRGGTLLGVNVHVLAAPREEAWREWRKKGRRSPGRGAGKGGAEEVGTEEEENQEEEQRN